MNLYPNPCHESLIIEASIDQVNSMEVYNNLGQKLQSITSVVFPYELNTGDLLEGQYFLVLSDGEIRTTKSFVKQ